MHRNPDAHRKYNVNYRKDDETGLTLYRPTDPAAKDRRAQWRLVFVDPATGKRCTRWARTRDEAQRKYAQINEYLSAGISAPANASAITFADLVDRYVHDRGDDWSPRTRGNVLYHCRRLAQDDMGLGRRTLAELIADPKLIDAALRQLAKTPRASTGRPLAQQTIEGTKGYLQTLFKFARMERLVPPSSDPMTSVKWPLKKNGRREKTVDQNQSPLYIEESEIPTDNAIESVITEWVTRCSGDQWWRELDVRLAATAGLRWGEQHALRPMDVNLDPARPTIRVSRQVTYDDAHKPTFAPPKMNKQRTVVFDPALIPMLQRRCDEVVATDGPGGLLFPAPRGGLPVYKNFRESFAAMAHHAGWPTDPETGKLLWTWHSLRHRAATHMLRRVGIPLETVSKYLGHSSKRYTHDRYVECLADDADVTVNLYASYHAERGTTTSR